MTKRNPRLVSSLLSLFAAVTPALISCEDLPETTRPLPKNRGGNAGTSMSGGGTTSKGGGGSSSGKGGKAGEGTGGSSGGSAPSAGSSGNAGSGGNAAEGGEVEPGSGGAEDGGATSGGTGGSSGNAGNSGKGGSGGNLGGAGSGGNAGKGGSGGGVVGEFFGDSRCSSGFDLCEDFESGDIDQGLWDVQASGDGPEVDDTRAARGDYSIHFHTMTSGFSYIRETDTFPATNNTYYGRMFVWIDALPSAPEWAHWSLSVGVGSGTESEVRLGGQLYSNDSEGKNFFGVGSDHGETGDWTNLDRDDAPDGVPEGEWVCVEWLNDGENNEGRVWINEVERPSLHTTATEHGGDGDYILPTFESVWFGWWHYQPGTTPAEFDTWIDEIVVDDERVGCSD